MPRSRRPDRRRAGRGPAHPAGRRLGADDRPGRLRQRARRVGRRPSRAWASTPSRCGRTAARARCCGPRVPAQPIDLVLLVDNSQTASRHINDLRQALTAFVQRHDGGPARGGARRPSPTGRPCCRTTPPAARRSSARSSGSSRSRAAAPRSSTRSARCRAGCRSATASDASSSRSRPRAPTSRTRTTSARSRTSRRAARRSTALVLTEPGGGDLTSDEARSRGIVLDEGTSTSGGRLERLLSSMALRADARPGRARPRAAVPRRLRAARRAGAAGEDRRDRHQPRARPFAGRLPRRPPALRPETDHAPPRDRPGRGAGAPAGLAAAPGAARARPHRRRPRDRRTGRGADAAARAPPAGTAAPAPAARARRSGPASISSR